MIMTTRNWFGLTRCKFEKHRNCCNFNLNHWSLHRIHKSLSIFLMCSNRNSINSFLIFVHALWKWRRKNRKSHYRIMIFRMRYPPKWSADEKKGARDVSNRTRKKTVQLIIENYSDHRCCTYPYCKHEAHPQFPHFHHQKRPLIPWSQRHDGHGEVLAVVLLD